MSDATMSVAGRALARFRRREYIDGMRMTRFAIAILILVGFQTMAGATALFLPTGGGDMDCCRPSQDCCFGMNRVHCCEDQPMPATSHATWLEGSSRRTVLKDVQHAAILASVVVEHDSRTAVAHIGFAKLSSAHRDPVPLFLLNTSILR